jgi:hypothetical protein
MNLKPVNGSAVAYPCPIDRHPNFEVIGYQKWAKVAFIFKFLGDN